MSISPSVFWNKKSTVKEFASYPPPAYWAEFLHTFKTPAKRAVLDVGCGGGRNSALAAHMHFNIHACDLHNEMVKKTKGVLRAYFSATELRKRIRRANIQRLPYPPHSFDIVIAHGVLHNTDRYEKFLRSITEITRVLKSDGFLCLNVFYFKKADSAVRPSKKYRHVFYTESGLPMILLPKKEILKILLRNHLHPLEKPAAYTSQVSTGKRNVLRGIFVKNG